LHVLGVMSTTAVYLHKEFRILHEFSHFHCTREIRK
jgi:hypothetical protein